MVGSLKSKIISGWGISSFWMKFLLYEIDKYLSKPSNSYIQVPPNFTLPRLWVEGLSNPENSEGGWFWLINEKTWEFKPS